MKRFIILFAALVCALGIARTDVHAQAQIPFARLTSSVPTNGTNASQRITIGGSPTTGGFTLEWNGLVSSAITWSATNATLLANIQTALDGLFASGNTVATAVSLTAGVGTIDVTFQGAYGKEPINAVMTVISNTLDGSGTVAIASQVTGVLASYRGAAPGSSLVYTGVNPPVTYTNTSTIAASPTWTILGTSAGITLGADSSTTGQTLTNSGLSFAVGTSQTWQFEVCVYDSSSSTAGIEFGYALPTGATIVSMGEGFTTGATAVGADIITASATSGVAVATAAGYSLYRASGIITTDGTHAGNAVFQYLKVTSGTAILKAGSYIIFRRIS